MTDYLFDPLPAPALPVSGESKAFPVNRIFCVGRNYVAHAEEMGQEVDREAPFYFTKSPAAVVMTGATTPYPPGTDDFHHEMEFVVAIGAPAYKVSGAAAMEAVFGYGAGLDMTRRDLQLRERAKQRPWSLGKDFAGSAVLAPLTRAAAFGAPGPQTIRLAVNGETRQEAVLDLMVWKTEEIIAHLSGFYALGPGDLIMTGTPAGVGPVGPGDRLEGSIDGLAPVSLTIGPAD